MSETAADRQTLFFTLATAGHVDHGKTSLLRALTGIDPDRLKEEQERQMTTDLGFAHMRVHVRSESDSPPGQNQAIGEHDLVISFIDVPGHGKFLKNMLAGVGGIDMALLVVASDEGPMPQTIQHTKILSLLGIKHAVVALTKIDMSSEAQQEDAEARVRTLLAQYQIDIVDFVKVSCTEKTGIKTLSESLSKNVLQLPKRTLLKGDAAKLEDNANAGANEQVAAFLPIDRVFSKPGYGAVVTGTLVRGEISVNDSVWIEPGEIKGRVRGLETFNQRLTIARAGQRLAVNISLKENKTIERGQAVVGQEVAPTKDLFVAIDKLDDLKASDFKNALNNQLVKLYHGTAECPSHLRWVAQSDDSSPIFGHLFLEQPLVASPQERFIIRWGDEGLAGGAILLADRPRWLNRNKVLQLLALCNDLNYNMAAKLFLESSPQNMLKEDALNILLPQTVKNTIVRDLLKSDAIKWGEQIVTLSSRNEIHEKILREVDNNAKNPDSMTKDAAGVSLEHLRNRILAGIDRQALHQCVHELVEAGKLARSGDRITLASGEKRAIPAETLKLQEKISEILANHICLELSELAKQTSSDVKLVTFAIGLMSQQGTASVVNYEFASLNTKLTEAHHVLAKLWREKRQITPADFRDGLGTSRKYAMALLAYFDDQRVTRRTGDSRALLKLPS